MISSLFAIAWYKYISLFKMMLKKYRHKETTSLHNILTSLICFLNS